MHRSRAFVVALVGITFVLGCAKPDRSEESPSTGAFAKAGTGCGANLKVVCNGVLVFNNWNHFDQVYNCLETARETWIQDFETAHPGLTEDAFDDLMYALAFNENQPLVDFDQALSHGSYRATIDALESAWESAGSSPASHPDNGNIIDDEVEETLYAAYGTGALVIVGTTAVYIDANGQEWHIPFSTCAALQAILNNPNGIPSNYKVVYAGANGELCNNNKSLYGSQYFEGTTRCMTYKLRWRFGGINTRAKAKMRMYKKKNLGWRKNRTAIAVRSFGDERDFECKLGLTYTVENPVINQLQCSKKRRVLKAVKRWNVNKTFATGEAKGMYRKVYDCGNFIQVDASLTF